MTKPIDLDKLVKAIGSVLGPRPAAGAITTDANAANAQGAAAHAPASDSTSLSSFPIDAETLLQRCEGNGSLAEELIETFERQLGEQVITLRQSLERRDREALTRTAHTIKGTAGVMAAPRVCDAASKLEALGALSDMEAATAALERLADGIHECLAFVPQARQRVQDISRNRKTILQ